MLLSELSWLTGAFADLSRCPHPRGRSRELWFSARPQQRRAVSGLVLRGELSVGVTSIQVSGRVNLFAVGVSVGRDLGFGRGRRLAGEIKRGAAVSREPRDGAGLSRGGYSDTSFPKPAR